MHIHFEFDGPFPTVRDELNAIQKTVAGDPRAEARITCELLHHVVTECVDEAQEAWLELRDPKAPYSIVQGSADVTVKFSRRSQ